MASAGVGIADVLDDRQVTLIKKPLQLNASGMKGDFIGQAKPFVFRQSQAGAVFLIEVVSKWNERV